MTRNEFIKHLEETYRLLQEEVEIDVTDYARFEACCCIDGAIQHIKENEYREDF